MILFYGLTSALTNLDVTIWFASGFQYQPQGFFIGWLLIKGRAPVMYFFSFYAFRKNPDVSKCLEVITSAIITAKMEEYIIYVR